MVKLVYRPSICCLRIYCNCFLSIFFAFCITFSSYLF